MTRTTRNSLALALAAMSLQACMAVVPSSALSPQSAPKRSSDTAESTVSGNSNSSTGAAKPAATSPSAPAAAASSAPMDNGGNLVAGEPPTAGAVADQAAKAPQPNQPPVQSQSTLKAGAIDDNAKFADFQAYQKAYSGPQMRTYDASERHVIQIKDVNGKPVPNMKVTVSAGEKVVFTGRTYANGQLLFHPKAVAGADVGSRFFVGVGDNTAEAIAFNRTLEGPWEVKVPVQDAAPPKLDVQFVLDTTGSMGGEIKKLQDTVQAIAGRIKGLEGSPQVRFGLVAYKDQNDSEYLTKKTDFTGSITDFQTALNGLNASGGGDIPEDLESALSVGLGEQSWDNTAPIRLSFVITDAVAHIDYQQTTPYTTSIVKAQGQGVKFYPIGTSGLPAEGEFMLRQLAQATMGQYLFITRGGDEFAGGGEVSATVDKFKEGRLDDIVVDIVKAELSSLDGQ